MANSPRLPNPTLLRLATIYKVLKDEAEEQAITVSSSRLEELTGIPATQIRKDLSQIGEMGKPGVGYQIVPLTVQIAKVMKLDKLQRFAIVGAGRLGQALAAYPGLSDYNFELAAIFDNDPKKIGTSLFGKVVQDSKKLNVELQKSKIRIAILTVVENAAQEIADACVAGGVRWILNFTPAHLIVPKTCLVRNVGVTQEFAVLSHFTDG